MRPRKRLQVFISSTYQDLREERQEAVQAILEAGHIPAGMELFAAGNQSQWEVIKEWIEESDAYMLVLGGRYGTIAPSGNSYIEDEYRFAESLDKPLFSMVFTDEYINKKIKPTESETTKDNYINFKKHVLSKVSALVDSPEQMKTQIFKALNLLPTDELSGWVPGEVLKELRVVQKKLEESKTQTQSLLAAKVNVDDGNLGVPSDDTNNIAEIVALLNIEYETYTSPWEWIDDHLYELYNTGVFIDPEDEVVPSYIRELLSMKIIQQVEDADGNEVWAFTDRGRLVYKAIKLHEKSSTPLL